MTISNHGNLAERGVSCVLTTDEADFAAYDALPPVVRQAIRACVCDMDSVSVAEGVMLGYPHDVIARMIAQTDLHNSRIWQLAEWGEVYSTKGVRDEDREPERRSRCGRRFR